MTLTDWQVGAKSEVTYNTPVVVDHFYEFDSESIADDFGRVVGNPLRTGGFGVMRNDRFTPYYRGANGALSLPVMTKAFGFWLTHLLGAVATTGPLETNAYTHVGTFGDLQGDSFTLQVNRPFNPTGANQPFTFSGGKIPSWTLSNSAEDLLMAELTCDFASCATATALATAAYPASMENLTFAGGVISIGGTPYDVTDFSVSVDNGMNLDRRQIRGNTAKKEPTTGRRTVTWTLNADFDSMAQRNRVASATRAGALATISAIWTGPTLLGTTIYPSLKIDIPAGRFDEWSGAVAGPDAITQTVSGVGLFDGTLSPLTATYVSGDITP